MTDLRVGVSLSLKLIIFIGSSSNRIASSVLNTLGNALPFLGEVNPLKGFLSIRFERTRKL